MISVVVPVYNSCKKINQCIMSIRNQTYTDIEIIIVDDGSNDGSLEICKKHSELDERVVIITQKNQGVSVARNVGINISSGEYIVFVDSDDYIEMSMCEELIKEMNKSNSDMVVCGFYTHCGDTVNEVGYGYKKYVGLKEISNDFSELYTKCFFNSPCNKLYKRKNIKEKFDESLSLGEDLLFNLKYLNRISVVTTLNRSYYHYNINHNEHSLTNKYREDSLQIKEKLFMELKKFCIRNSVNNMEGLYSGYFCEIYYCFQQIVFFSKKNKCELRDEILLWMKKESTIEVVEKVNKVSGQLAIGKFLIKRQQANTLIVLLWLKKYALRMIRSLKGRN